VTTAADTAPESQRANGAGRCQTIMRVTELALASLPDAPSCGRLLVQRYLSAWGIAHMIDEAQLVMSELLTNAVKASAEFTTIQIRLAVLGGTSLLIEVRDCNPEPPVLKDASGDNEGGRGLMIVDALCERWGYYHPTQGSKAVWAELLIPLPTREPEHLDMPPVAAMDDPRVLHRVHTGLKNLQVRGDGSAAQQVWTQGRYTNMAETWETAVRMAANTMLRYPDKISDGLEAELYALLEQLDTTTAEQPASITASSPLHTPATVCPGGA